MAHRAGLPATLVATGGAGKVTGNFSRLAAYSRPDVTDCNQGNPIHQGFANWCKGLPVVECAMSKRVVGRPFQPGQSGNPSGRPKMPEALKARIAKLASKDAVDVLEAALKDGDPKVKLQAAGMLMDRAWGKAITPSEVKVEAMDINAQHLRVLQDRMARRQRAQAGLALVAGMDIDQADNKADAPG